MILFYVNDVRIFLLVIAVSYSKLHVASEDITKTKNYTSIKLINSNYMFARSKKKTKTHLKVTISKRNK